MAQLDRERDWILIVDDDAEFNQSLGAFLGKLGIHLEQTVSVPTFKAALKNLLPAACLIDLNIDGLQTGFNLIKELKKKYGTKLPIIVISGDSDPATIAHAIECGADDFIPKPINPQVLNVRLGRFLPLIKNPDPKSFSDAPPGGFPANISVKLSIRGIDELGFQAICPHFFCKGAAVYLRNSFFAEVFPNRENVIAAVLSCDPQADGSHFVCFEFIELQPNDRLSLRTFLETNKS